MLVSATPHTSAPPPTPKSRALQVLRPLFIILIGLLIAAGLYMGRGDHEKQVIEPNPVLVDAIEVFNETLAIKISTHGTVAPSTETRLSSEVQGKIINVADSFVAGGHFKRGDTLLSIDDLEYRTAVIRAKASLAHAETLLAEEQGRAEVAYQDWVRHNRDGKRSAKAKSLALRKPQIAEAKANLKAAEADLDRAKENLSRTSITAPYDGLVRSRKVDLGQHVAVGTELGVAFATATAEVRLPVPDHKVALLKMPQRDDSGNPIYPAVKLTMKVNDTEFHWQAKLKRVESALDERSRVLHVVAEIDTPYQTQEQTSSDGRVLVKPALRIGSFVEAEITGRVIENVVRIPLNVLQTDGTVWLIGNNGAIYEQPVNVLTSDQKFVYVSDGLSDRDRIAMGYVDVTIPGTRVEVANLIQLPSTPGPNKSLPLHSESTNPITNGATDEVAAQSAKPMANDTPSRDI